MSNHLSIYVCICPFPSQIDYTPLHWASLYGHTPTAEMLLAKGANVEAKSKVSTARGGAGKRRRRRKGKKSGGGVFECVYVCMFVYLYDFLFV